MREIEIHILHKLLWYNSHTGKLYWRRRPEHLFADARTCRSWNSKFANQEAFTRTNNKGYYVSTILGEAGHLAQRVAWALHYGHWPENTVDHEDGDPSNNRLQNLRSATREQNQRNQKMPTTNTSGHVGVHWENGKWKATIGIGQHKKKYLGRFESLEDAVAARQDAERELGYHPNHGR